MDECSVKKSHVWFLLLMMLLSSNIFRLTFVSGKALKTVGILVSFVLVAWGVKKIIFNFRVRKYAAEVWFIPLLLCGIFLSMFSALFFWNQSLLKSLFVIYPWGYIMSFFVFAYYGYNKRELYKALKIYSILFFTVQIIALLLPYNIIGSLSDEIDVSRGVRRLRIGGLSYMHFWGFYNVVLYCAERKKKYLCGFLVCLLFVILSVSRQHIVLFSILSLGYMLLNLKMTKMIGLLFVGVLCVVFLLPQTSIYQGLVVKEHDETVYVDGETGNVRWLATKYFLHKFPSNDVTKIIGNCQYNMESKYGEHIASLRVFFLSDIGFVGIYIYYGLLGLFCFFAMFFYIWRVKKSAGIAVFKIFLYYLFLTNILSHSFDVSQVGIAASLYFLASNSPKVKGANNASCVYYSRQ